MMYSLQILTSNIVSRHLRHDISKKDFTKYIVKSSGVHHSPLFETAVYNIIAEQEFKWKIFASGWIDHTQA